KRHLQRAHGLTKDAIGIAALERAFTRQPAEVIVENGRLCVASIRRDEPDEDARYGCEVRFLAFRHRIFLSLGLVHELPEHAPESLVELSHVDRKSVGKTDLFFKLVVRGPDAADRFGHEANLPAKRSRVR